MKCLIVGLAIVHAASALDWMISLEERQINEPHFKQLRDRFGDAPARIREDIQRRQITISSSASHAASSVGSQIQTNSAATLTGTIPINITTTLEPTSALPTTYLPGATGIVRGAPTLPNVVISPADWPALDKVPPTDSPQVQEWMRAIDWSLVPDIPVNQLGGCSNASNAQALANAAENGWWTCGGHTRSTDVVSCPEKMTWGMSYDDGPSPDTPRLLTYLAERDLKSTFFVVGSRVVSRPQTLQYEYMAGNQISVHTWSHPMLTTKTNEEVVAELGWTKEAIKRVIGVTPNTMRPPYGDCDDRIRGIAMQMNLSMVIWSSVEGTNFNTQDWQVAGGVVSADLVVDTWKGILNNASKLDSGFLSLQHDLNQQSTSLAIDYLLPYALNTTGLKAQPIYQCLGKDIADVYIETGPQPSAKPTVDRGSAANPTSPAGSSGHNVTPGTSPAVLALFAVVAIVVSGAQG